MKCMYIQKIDVLSGTCFMLEGSFGQAWLEIVDQKYNILFNGQHYMLTNAWLSSARIQRWLAKSVGYEKHWTLKDAWMKILQHYMTQPPQELHNDKILIEPLVRSNHYIYALMHRCKTMIVVNNDIQLHVELPSKINVEQWRFLVSDTQQLNARLQKVKSFLLKFSPDDQEYLIEVIARDPVMTMLKIKEWALMVEQGLSLRDNFHGEEYILID